MALKTLKISKEVSLQESSNVESQLWLVTDNDMFNLSLTQIIKLHDALGKFIELDQL